jgi:competence protein ComEA
LVIDVAGDVRKPGIYRLPAGSRVYQAVRAAGGALPGTDTTGLNMAAPLSDGEQIIVGGPPGSGGTVLAPQPGTAPGEGSAGSSAPVSLNSATQEQLESLPGVGPVLAQKILDWRTEHGRFSSVDELRQVPGIGEVKFAALKSRVTL